MPEIEKPIATTAQSDVYVPSRLQLPLGWMKIWRKFAACQNQPHITVCEESSRHILPENFGCG